MRTRSTTERKLLLNLQSAFITLYIHETVTTKPVDTISSDEAHQVRTELESVEVLQSQSVQECCSAIQKTIIARSACNSSNHCSFFSFMTRLDSVSVRFFVHREIVRFSVARIRPTAV